MSAHLLGVDIGTQGTKTCLYHSDGTLVASAFEASHLIEPAPGAVEQEPDDIYGSVLRTIHEVIIKSNINPAHIAAIGMCGQMAGIMGIDRSFQAVTPYDNWLDTRCEGEIAHMREIAGDRIVALTGAPVSYNHGPKVLRWKNQFPEIYAKIDKFILPVTYVAGKMCGLTSDDAWIDQTCFHFSGFSDIEHLAWSDELLETFGVDGSKMPVVVPPWKIVGKVTADAARECGIIEGTMVCAGAGDQAATSLGAGITKPGLAFDVAGTASVFSRCTDSYAPDVKNKTVLYARSILPGLWIPLAYIGGGGLCIRWIRDTLAGSNPSVTYDSLAEEARFLPPGSEKLMFVPHFSGRVCPNDPFVHGSFTGLTARHGRAHLYRAVMESIGYEYALYDRILNECTENVAREVYVIGGGAKSSLFNQIKSDILGIRYTALETVDTSTLGAAIVAGYAAGIYADMAEVASSMVKKTAWYYPDADKHKAYAHYSAIYPEILTALRDIYKKL
jgi:xylulokinase